jgi:hypothetical protein
LSADVREVFYPLAELHIRYVYLSLFAWRGTLSSLNFFYGGGGSWAKLRKSGDVYVVFRRLAFCAVSPLYRLWKVTWRRKTRLSVQTSFNVYTLFLPILSLSLFLL